MPFHAAENLRDVGHGTDGAVVDPALVRTLAMKSLEAARAAGATYADVRLTRTIQEDFKVSGAPEDWRATDQDRLAVGVRALVNGYWGFASTPYWSADEAVRVGTLAATLATANARGPARPFAFAPAPVVTGSWQTPITIDPFRLTLEEKLDYMRAIIVDARRLLPATVRSGDGLSVGGPSDSWEASFRRQECALATSEGSYVTQTLYRARGTLHIWYLLRNRRLEFKVFAHGLTETGKGWELLTEATLIEQLPGMLEELEAKRPIPYRPVEVGRTAMVCDAVTTASLLDVTLGRATEVDRALGYEANATGTSYLGPDPLTVLGTAVANPMVTVMANRSLPSGLATVKWDAEGVVPDDFPLVRDGMLVDYQTTREQAAWLAPWYQKVGTPVKSHGCANAGDASVPMLQLAPNLALAPAATQRSYEDLVAGITTGIALEGCTATTDFQCRTGKIAGISGGTIYQIRNGKRVAQLGNAGVLFETPGLWKNVTALGGAASAVHLPQHEVKGEQMAQVKVDLSQPGQSAMHTVSAVPMVVDDMSIIDLTRRA
jgi:TldD protein